MPRSIRDYTDSEKVNSLSPMAECVFARLLLKVDDYGNFPYNPKVIRAQLFPLKLDRVRESDIVRCLLECEAAELFTLYKVADKTFLNIGNFNQAMKFPKAVYPQPQNGEKPKKVRGAPIEVEVETEIEVEIEKENTPVGGFSDFIKHFNSITGRHFRNVGKVERQYNQRLKDGYTIEQMLTATKNCFSDPFHKQNPNYLTPEFITRQDKLDKYLNYVQTSPTINSGFPNHYSPDFEKKCDDKTRALYWKHLNQLGWRPKRSEITKQIIDWVKTENIAS